MIFSVIKKWYKLFMIVVFLQSCAETEKSQIRILSAGISHESNTFCPYLTTENNFTVLRGEEVFEKSDWANFFKDSDIKIIPTLHAYASPYGVVSRVTFEKLLKEILERAKKAGKVDGVFLDMHGALHVEGYEDAQVNFVNALREVVGKDILISGSFDLHGNMSAEFVKKLDILTAYRTAPHMDGSETRIRAVQLLAYAIKSKKHPVIAHITIPLMIPGEKGITFIEPLKSIYERLPAIAKKDGLLDASVFVGYAWGDVPRSAMSVQVVAEDSSYLPLAEKEAEKLALDLWNVRQNLDYEVPVGDIDSAIQMAQNDTCKTVFISDSGDNTTAGAPGDIPLVLERLIALGVKDAVVAGIVDKGAVQACAKAGVGILVKLNIGGKLDTVFGKPLPIEGIVCKITQTNTNDSAAVVDINGIQVVLLSQRRSFTTVQDFEEVDIDPLGHKIVVVKLGYLFPGLREIAPKSILALSPGMAFQVLESLPYKNVRRPIYPLDPDMTWKPDKNN